MAPFAAALIERYGVTRVVLTAITMIVVGLLLALVMSQAWHLIVLWGIVVGVGTGLTALVLSAIVSTRWFSQRRGLVLGMLTASSATGQLVFLPLAAWLVEHFGWRYALAPSVIGLLIAGVLVGAVHVRPARPTSALRLMASRARVEKYRRAHRRRRRSGAPFRCSAKSRRAARSGFWPRLSSSAGSAPTASCRPISSRSASIIGMPAVAAASTLAMMGVFDFFGTILSGWLSDRYDNRALLFWYYGLRGLSLLYLPYSTFTFYGLSLFGAFYGLDWIATVPPTVRLSAQAFGKEKAGIAFGWIFAAHQLGAATAAFGAGLSRSVLQSYLPAFFAAGAMCLVASAIVWLIRAKSRARPLTPQSAAASPRWRGRAIKCSGSQFPLIDQTHRRHGKYM